MVLDAVSNFVRGTADAAVGTGDTTVSVDDASIFPDPETDGEFNVVIWDVNNFPRPDQDGDVEIMRVTARDTTADELTVTRAQEMTSAAAHPEGSAIHLSPTAKMFSDIEDTFADFWDADTQELTADVNNTNTTTQALDAESLGITNAGTILQIGQGIPAGGFSIELGAADDVTSTDFTEVAKAYGVMHNRDKPEGMVLYGRAFARATVSDGEEMTVRPVGGGEGAIRVFEDLEITVDTDFFQNYDTGWINVDQDNRLISARNFEAKVTGGTGSFSSSAGNQLQCHFEWRVE